MRRLWVVLVLLAGCGADEATPESSSTSTSGATTTTEVPAVSVEDVREAAFGTAACFDDPACPIVESVELQGERMQVTTGLFPDEDAEAPGLAVCVAATQVFDGRVQVLGSDGSVLASGRRDSQPVCS